MPSVTLPTHHFSYMYIFSTLIVLLNTFDNALSRQNTTLIYTFRIDTEVDLSKTIDMFSASIPAALPISIQAPLERPPLQRRVTCSIAEPTPETKRSYSGKPFAPPRVKSPAPRGMIERNNVLRSSLVRTSSMPVGGTPLRFTMSRLKRKNSAGRIEEHKQ
jgi:hypothetical protein